MKSPLSNHTVFHLTLGTLVAGLSACDRGSDLPNDPLPVLVCEEGYVIDGSRTGCIPADTVIVHGVVRDSASERPVAGVQVLVHPMDGSVTTDANGYFKAVGVPTTDDVIVTFIHQDYFAATLRLGQGEDDGGDVGHVVWDASINLDPKGRPTLVAGTVYGGDAPAVGATVILYNESFGFEELSTTTDASGGFVFASVPADTYELRVLPFDEDGDSVHDYHFFSMDLGDIGTTGSGYNLSNLVIPLRAIEREILFANFLPLLDPDDMELVDSPISGIRLASETSSILLHFGAEVDTSTVELALRHYSLAPGDGEDRYGDAIPFAATWSNGDTVLTVARSGSDEWFTADSNPESLYVFTIGALVWADGTMFISQTDPDEELEFIFDVSSTAPVLSSPAPAFFVDKRNSQALDTQVADHVSCDAWQCWVLDSDGYYFNGWQGTPIDQPDTPGYFNNAAGFDIKWPYVAGAAEYNVYARKRSSSTSGTDYGTWYLLDAEIDVIPEVDPVFGPEIDAEVLTDDWTGSGGPAWDGEFVIDGIGPLGGGAEIDIVVTALDADGFESPIDPANALTISDTMAAAAYDVTVNNPTAEYGSSLIKRDIVVDFSEYMNTVGDPVITLLGGNIIGLDAPSEIRWENDTYVSPENAGDRVTVVEQQLQIRGTCSPITCRATTDQNSICVADPSLFSGVSGAFFITPAGGIAHPRQTISSVSGNIITFSSNFTATLDPAITDILACATGGDARSFATLRLAGNGTTVVDVNSAEPFYVGGLVAIHDLSDNDFTTATVNGVRTYPNTDNELDLSVAIPVTFSAGSVVIPIPPGNAEYALRPAQEITLRHDVNVTGPALNVQMEADLLASSVMVGDTCLLDLDGDVQRTIDDRHFVVVDDVVMDAPDYSLALSSLPLGAYMVRHVTKVVCLGDGVTVGNGAVALSDTSGNQGLQDFADQMSDCDPTPPADAWCENFGVAGKFTY